jgi:hypothetical protein
MPYLIPSRTPLPPEQVERGFDYLLALQMGGGAAAGRGHHLARHGRGRGGRPVLGLLRTERGRVRAAVRALQDWARDSPTTATPGIARSIIRFTVNVIPDPDDEDTADTLETMRAEHLAMAAAFHGHQ